MYKASLRLVYIASYKVTVECSFSAMKEVKTRLRNHLVESTLDRAMPVSTEDPSMLSDDELATIVAHSKT